MHVIMAVGNEQKNCSTIIGTVSLLSLVKEQWPKQTLDVRNYVKELNSALEKYLEMEVTWSYCYHTEVVHYSQAKLRT